jgi:hypothetical protein
VMGAGASADMLGLVTVSAATALIMGQLFQGLMARRSAQGQPAQAPASAGE